MNQPSLEQVLGVAALAILLAASYLVVAPFLSATAWAVILVYTTWPAYRWLRQRRLSPSLASLTMVTGALLILVVPLAALVPSMGNQMTLGIRWMREVFATGLPPPPGWVEAVPLVGPLIAEEWRDAAQSGFAILRYLTPYAENLAQLALTAGLGIGTGLLELAFSLVIMFFLYRDGEAVAGRVQGGLERLTGARAKRLLDVAGSTVKGVVYGMLGTAVIQGVVAGIGYWLAGLPAPAFLGILTAVLSLTPIGPPLVWVPAALWLFQQDETFWAIFMIIWGAVPVSSSDNVIRPWLIHKVGATKTPLLLVLIGVLGGAFAFGLLGVFLGPTLLAVVYMLVLEWTQQRRHGRPARIILPD
ncbi:AI-2E family transporter [Geminicoccus flavidas]|uniref:AI-2E family transporter n=1 Tax=Geminicoccus flavidas TaxID=2506407 RepID=UPI00135AEFFF|nr:AI-2E family transporter [Geminicoccus flavidas]